jgi:hypothetical protein
MGMGFIGDREGRQWDSAGDGSDCGGHKVGTRGPRHRIAPLSISYIVRKHQQWYPQNIYIHDGFKFQKMRREGGEAKCPIA